MTLNVVSITDSATAKAVLVAAGIPAEVFTRGRKPGENLAWHAFEHDSRYWLASYHYGHPKPEDNGFALVGIPQEGMTKLQAAAFFDQCIADFSTSPLREELVELSPVKS
jgi:hypothetical protein